MSKDNHNTNMHDANSLEKRNREVDVIRLSTSASKREVNIPTRTSFFFGMIVAFVFVIILLITL